MSPRTLTPAQREYETRRAAKAGLSLDKWLALKDRQAEADAKAKAKTAEPPKPAKPPGLLRRMVDRAHQPLKPDPKSPAKSTPRTQPRQTARQPARPGAGKK